MDSKDKIDAIYKLRDAAEQKAHAERDLEDSPSPEARDAQLTLEKSTYQAITVCHECGREHGKGEPHAKGGNVIEFRRRGSGTD